MGPLEMAAPQPSAVAATAMQKFAETAKLHCLKGVGKGGTVSRLVS